MLTVRQPLKNDLSFISGAYAVVLISFAFTGWWLNSLMTTEPTRGQTMVLDMLFLSCSLLTVVFAAAVARFGFVVPLICAVVISLFILDIYFLLGYDTQTAFDLLNRADFWSYLAVGLLNIRAYFLPGLRKHEYVALIGWSFFTFGHLLSFGEQLQVAEFSGFVPMAGGLIFWVWALWAGSRQYSSR